MKRKNPRNTNLKHPLLNKSIFNPNAMLLSQNNEYNKTNKKTISFINPGSLTIKEGINNHPIKAPLTTANKNKTLIGPDVLHNSIDPVIAPR